MKRSPTLSLPVDGSMRRPPLMWIFIASIARQDAHHSHAHRDTERHLRQDHRLAPIWNGRADVDAAIDWAGMHDDRVRLGERELVGSESVVLEVFAGAGQERAAHALILQAQHDHYIDALQPSANIVEHAHAQLLNMARQQGSRADDPYLLDAEDVQGLNLRACYAGMQHIADDGNPQTTEAALVVPDGEHVEQRLRWMRMASVAGIDHMDVRPDVAGDQMRRAALT